MRRALRLLVRLSAGLVLTGTLLLVGLSLVFGLDLGSAFRAAFLPAPDYTVDPESLREDAGYRVVWQGNLLNTWIDEASGLAPSRRRTDLLWVINDSGGGPYLYAGGLDGRDLGRVALDANNIDWEDLASFELDGTPYLLVADVGDNYSWRPGVTLYLLEEPFLEGARFADGTQVSPSWIMRLRFEDGPADCEGVAVDVERKEILLLTKRTVPPRLYVAPLGERHDDPTATPAPLVAKRVAVVDGIPQPTEADYLEDPEAGGWRSCPTGLSLSPDGRRAVVTTIKDLYIFERGATEDWGSAFSRLPVRVRAPPMSVTEAGCFAHDEDAFYLTTEGRPAPLFRFERPERAAQPVQDVVTATTEDDAGVDD